MGKQYRVKAFLFINADNVHEAEQIAGKEIGAGTYRNKGALIEQILIREGGTKLINLKPKHK